MQIPLLGADGEAECGDEQKGRSNPGGSLARWALQGVRRAAARGSGSRRPGSDEAPGQRLGCRGHWRWEPEEAGGACAEPDNPAGRTRGCAGGARREPHFGGGEGRGETQQGPQALGR